MNNDITKLLGIADEDVLVDKVEIDKEKLVKTIYLSKKYRPAFCPVCGCRMYSQGHYPRKLNHPVLQDGFQLILICSMRKFRCTNSLCNTYINEIFSFAPKGSQSTHILPILIGKEMKNIESSCTSIAQRLFISDTLCREIFMRYCLCERLSFSEVISIDEVYLNFDAAHKYALVIMDFTNGEIIDILSSRRENETYRYFTDISVEERDKVNYLICDMYNPYIAFTGRYFKNAKCVVDSFHVLQWLMNALRGYIRKVLRSYQKKDEEKLKESNDKTNRDYKTIKSSREVYLLSNYSWVLLKNQDHIHYSAEKKKNHFLNQYLDSYDYEKMFLALDDHFKEYREWKEKYVSFNNDLQSDSSVKEKQLDELIEFYRNTQDGIFAEFSSLLKDHKKEILNSFTTVHVQLNSKEEQTIRRLSNGPMESFNNVPKDLKRVSNGVSNFEYTRLRLLWASRSETKFRAVPLSLKEIKNPTGKKRGKYNKKIKG